MPSMPTMAYALFTIFASQLGLCPRYNHRLKAPPPVWIFPVRLTGSFSMNCSMSSASTAGFVHRYRIRNISPGVAQRPTDMVSELFFGAGGPARGPLAQPVQDVQQAAAFRREGVPGISILRH